MSRITTCAAALAAALAFTPAAFAQQGDMRSMNMQGHDMGGMDMQTMMNRCKQLRHDAQHGARMTANAKRMMTQCDQMDSQMGNMHGGMQGMGGMQGGPDQRAR